MRSVFVLQGEVDLSRTEELRAELGRWHRASSPSATGREVTEWVVDCSGVTFLDCAGFSVLERFRLEFLDDQPLSLLSPPSTVCTSIDGLWILTMLLIRPGTVWLILYCSGSRMRSDFRKGDPDG